MAELTAATFRPHVDSRFRVRLAPDRAVELTLYQVEERPPHPRLPRAPFSLLFRGDRAQPLAQQRYPFEHDALGALEIFIVPIGPDEHGLRYQAVFN
ncbi:MAG TPA: hypothetical protein VFF06_21815 [Polyangia bacterium]|nr:hypothetical protein [Polyangia bacterium]